MEIITIGGAKTGPDGYLRYEVTPKPAPRVNLVLTFGATVLTIACERKVDAGRKFQEFLSKGFIHDLATGDIYSASDLTASEIAVVNGEI
jgi:hypothetical protein